MNDATKKKFHEKIEGATSLLNSALHDLDTRRDPCKCCGLEKARNWREFQISETLTGMVERLATIQQKLRADDRAKKESDHGKDRS